MKAKRGQRFAVGLVVAITAGFWLIYLAVDSMYWGSREDWKGGVPTLVTRTLDADLSIFEIVGTRVVDTFSESDITPFAPVAVSSSGATATQDLTWWLPITGGTRPPQVGATSTSIFAPVTTRTAGVPPSPVTHAGTPTSVVLSSPIPTNIVIPPTVGPTSTATKPAPTATPYVAPTATTAPTQPPPTEAQPTATDIPQPTATPRPPDTAVPPTDPPPTDPPPPTSEPTQEGGSPMQAQNLSDGETVMPDGRLLAQLVEMVDQLLAGFLKAATLD